MTMVDNNGGSHRELTGRKVLVWLFGFFGIIFAANAVFIYLALGTFPGVVVESSYEAGQAYNREIAAAKVQEALDWQVTSDLQPAPDGGGRLVVTARDASGTPLFGVDIEATLRSPVRDDADLAVAFTAEGGGRYVGTIADLHPGNWNLVLEISEDGARRFRSENRIYVKE